GPCARRAAGAYGAVHADGAAGQGRGVAGSDYLSGLACGVVRDRGYSPRRWRLAGLVKESLELTQHGTWEMICVKRGGKRSLSLGASQCTCAGERASDC